MKGKLFAMAREAGITDRSRVAAAALRRVLSEPRITTAVVGVATVQQLQANLQVVEHPDLDQRDQDIVSAMMKTRAYQENAELRKKAHHGSDDLTPGT